MLLINSVTVAKGLDMAIEILEDYLNPSKNEVL